MSALAAVLSADGSAVDAQSVERMLHRVPYLGPDGLAAKVLPGLALGHGLMIITAEDRKETQPFTCPTRGDVIVSDARIRNRAELLDLFPGIPRDAGDAQLLLAAYQEWGARGLRQVIGDYAFIVWDAERKQVVCARDGYGQRPLFYAKCGGRWVIGSDIQQLAAGGLENLRPNHDAILNWLTPFNATRTEPQTTSTFFDGIHAIAPGCATIFDANGPKHQEFWKFTQPAALRMRSNDEYVEAFKHVFTRVIQDSLRCEGPRGILLSGGLDSASIACEAADILGLSPETPSAALQSFTFTYSGLECDESELVREVQRVKGITGEFLPFRGTRNHFASRRCDFLEAPNCGIPEAQAVLYKAVRDRGVRLVLNGECAEGILSGGWSQVDSLIRGLKLRQAVRHLLAARRIAGSGTVKEVLAEGLASLLPPTLQNFWQARCTNHRFRKRRLAQLPRWFSESTWRELRHRNLELCLNQVHDVSFRSPLHRSQARLLYPPAVARQPCPWPVQICRPFSDRRLHEFLFAVPPEVIFQADRGVPTQYGAEKQLLRKALRGSMPDRIRLRTDKTYFESSVRDQLLAELPLYARTFDPAAGRSRVYDLGLVEPHLFWERFLAIKEELSGSDVPYFLRILDLENWLAWLDNWSPTNGGESGHPLSMALHQ